MPPSALIGTKLRERRLALGLKQAVVADTAGISPSYLNLIEHNRRVVGAGGGTGLRSLGAPVFS